VTRLRATVERPLQIVDPFGLYEKTLERLLAPLRARIGQAA
jgi:hypothetical protein